MPMQMCPNVGDAEAKQNSDMVGTYTDPEKCGPITCTADVTAMGPFLCVCFKANGIPFSGTHACASGKNVWANYSGYCFYTDGTDYYQQCKREPALLHFPAPPIHEHTCSSVLAPCVVSPPSPLTPRCSRDHAGLCFANKLDKDKTGGAPPSESSPLAMAR